MLKVVHMMMTASITSEVFCMIGDNDLIRSFLRCALSLLDRIVPDV